MLCNDSRRIIKDAITKDWYQIMKSYDQEDAMKNGQAFREKIDTLCKSLSPVLHALLNASFVPLIALEGVPTTDSPNGFKLFDHGRPSPPSDLLMLNRQELLTDTRILLPFWYTVPIISSPAFSIVRGLKSPNQPLREIRKNGRIDPDPGDTHDAKEKKREELKKAAKTSKGNSFPKAQHSKGNCGPSSICGTAISTPR